MQSSAPALVQRRRDPRARLCIAPYRAGGVRLPAEAEPDKPMIEAALQKARGVISQAVADLGLPARRCTGMEKMGIES